VVLWAIAVSGSSGGGCSGSGEGGNNSACGDDVGDHNFWPSNLSIKVLLSAIKGRWW